MTKLRILISLMQSVLADDSVVYDIEIDKTKITSFLSNYFLSDTSLIVSEYEARLISFIAVDTKVLSGISNSTLKKLRLSTDNYSIGDGPVCVDIFCGSGGLSEGFHQAGFSLALAADFDETALRTFRFNIPHKQDSVLNIDLNENWKEVVGCLKGQRVDIICGGPPCQGFSIIGRAKRGTLEERKYGFIDDPRNHLFKSFVNIVKKVSPPVFLMENVSAVRSARNYEELITSSFRDCGYRVESHILNAADFGVPQDRNRIFFMGFKNELNICPEDVFKKVYLLGRQEPEFFLKDALEGLPSVKPISSKNAAYLEKREHGRTVLPVETDCSSKFTKYIGGDREPFCFNHKSRFNNERDIAIFGTLKPGQDSRAESINHLMPYRKDVFSDKYYKLSPEKKSKTILAHMKFDANSYIHPFHARPLTPREAARCQTYPDDFVFMGSISSQFRQIGNSVPCKLAKCIAEVISNELEKACYKVDITTEKFPLPKKIRLATVFSGIGAVEWALKRLEIPHEIVFACDNDKFVKDSYFANYDINDEHWFDDIRSLDGFPFRGKVDLFVGGSPCQSFSFVGKKAGLEDTRGTLFYEFARLINEIQPGVFIYENVKGLINHDKGKTWKVMRDVFDELGYLIHEKTLNAKHYGIPQHRERLFVIGFKDKSRDFVFPTRVPLKWKMHDFLQDSFSISMLDSVELTRSQEEIDEHHNFKLPRNQFNINDSYFDKYILSDKVKKYVLSTGTKNFYSKPEIDLDIARPLLATMHKMHRAGVDNYMLCRGGRVRKLTPRECLRLMGFDDRFIINVSNLQVYRQTGNSIVVDVLIEILKQIIITAFPKG